MTVTHDFLLLPFFTIMFVLVSVLLSTHIGKASISPMLAISVTCIFNRPSVAGAVLKTPLSLIK